MIINVAKTAYVYVLFLVKYEELRSSHIDVAFDIESVLHLVTTCPGTT